MGYTHYWNTNLVALRDHLDEVHETVADLLWIARAYEIHQVPLDVHTSMRHQVGVNHHGRFYKSTVESISFNQAENGHEPFSFPPNEDFEFCKTAEKPYDAVVVACLTVLAHRWPNIITVSSDGDAHEWERGVQLARKVLGLEYPNPIQKTKAEEARNGL